VGALIVFFAHSLGTLLTKDEQIVRVASLVMGLTAWLVIMPLSIATILTGFVQAFGTAWGLLRHYWVLFKLLLTAFATGVLLLKLQPISDLATAAARAGFSTADTAGLRTSLTVHAAGGLVVLMAALCLAIYKPAGRIRGGGPLPRWAKLFGAVLMVFAVLVLGMVLVGRHGPAAFH
jgi:hypothetical protein